MTDGSPGRRALANGARLHHPFRMVNPIALAAALSRTVAITCPRCHKRKLVAREPKQYRVCPRCHHRFPDPLQRRRR